MLLIGDGLKRELSESQLALSQFDQAIEHRCSRAKACRQVLFDPMKDLLEMIDDRDDTEHSLDHHAVIAFTLLTKPPVERLVPTFAKAHVAEDLRLIGPSLSDLTKVLVMGVSSCPSPVNAL